VGPWAHSVGLKEKACPARPMGSSPRPMNCDHCVLLTFSLLCNRAVAAIAYMPSILKVCETRSDPSREVYPQWSIGSPDTHVRSSQRNLPPASSSNALKTYNPDTNTARRQLFMCMYSVPATVLRKCTYPFVLITRSSYGEGSKGLHWPSVA
jgi:hypothetical protein